MPRPPNHTEMHPTTEATRHAAKEATRLGITNDAGGDDESASSVGGVSMSSQSGEQPHTRAGRDIDGLPTFEPRWQEPRIHPLRITSLSLASVALVLLVFSQLLASPRARYPGTNPPIPVPDSPSDSDGVPDYTVSPDWDYDAPPTRREFDWTIGDSSLRPDGVWRPMMTINEHFPGPLVEVNEGDTIVATVHNKAKNSTSIHWHGIYQNSTNHMDGTVGVTQCPIAPGSSFIYEFQVKGQYGTYWYHSHLAVQSADGLFGPLVVHSKEEQRLQSLSYATDRVIMLSDHYHTPTSTLLENYLRPDMENAEPVPDNPLLNGLGIRHCNSIPTDRNCSIADLRHPAFHLPSAQRHRLRIINTGAFAEFQLSIDEHSFDVTEVDGTTVQPATLERLNINPAQRYSLIFEPKPEIPAAWLRAKMLDGCFTDPPPWLETDVLAALDFSPSTSNEPGQHEIPLPKTKDYPTGPSLECRDLNTSTLHPLPAIRAPATADATFRLRSNFEIGPWALSRGFFNGSSFRADVASPTLHRAVDGLGTRNRSWVSDFADPNTPGREHRWAWVNDEAFDVGRELVVQTTGLRVLDFVVSNFDDGNHPLHLHGYKFFVLAQGGGYPPEDIGAYPGVDLGNPLRRDTASVEAFGWVWLRLIADNPGVWALHCHIAWHSEAGLLMQLITRADEMRDWEIPAENKALCNKPLKELRKGMGPEDEYYMHD